MHEEFVNRLVFDPILSAPPPAPAGTRPLLDDVVRRPGAHEQELLRAEGRALVLGAAVSQAEAALNALADARGGTVRTR